MENATIEVTDPRIRQFLVLLRDLSQSGLKTLHPQAQPEILQPNLLAKLIFEWDNHLICLSKSVFYGTRENYTVRRIELRVEILKTDKLV